jgi:hypothetical protein
MKDVGALMASIASLLLAVGGIWDRIDRRRSDKPIKRRRKRGGSFLCLLCWLVLSWSWLSPHLHLPR